MLVHKGRKPGPRRILFYAPHGVGKTTWASQAPSPIFMNLEDGLADIDVAQTPLLTSYGDVVNAISWILQNGSEFRTVVFDTVDWLERIIHAEIAAAANVKAITDIDYGKGYGATIPKWEFLLLGMKALQDAGKGIILLAHANIKKFNPPGKPAYDRYEPDLHHTISSVLQEWVQDVLFGRYRIFTATEDAGFGKTRTIGVGGTERYIQTAETAEAIAKNRLNLPPEIPMDWNAYASFIPRATPAAVTAAVTTATPAVSAGNVDGVVVDGSSKVTQPAA